MRGKSTAVHQHRKRGQEAPRVAEEGEARAPTPAARGAARARRRQCVRTRLDSLARPAPWPSELPWALPTGHQADAAAAPSQRSRVRTSARARAAGRSSSRGWRLRLTPRRSGSLLLRAPAKLGRALTPLRRGPAPRAPPVPPGRAQVRRLTRERTMRRDLGATHGQVQVSGGWRQASSKRLCGVPPSRTGRRWMTASTGFKPSMVLTRPLRTAALLVRAGLRSTGQAQSRASAMRR